jgi:hypothetical protein
VVKRLPYQFAAPLLNIKKIDACRMDSNHCLPDAGNGRSKFFQFHDLWTAVGVNANGVHHRPFDTARWNWPWAAGNWLLLFMPRTQ